jgi:hypothetical protein
MTVCMAWVAERKDGRRYLYFATDSRTRGGMVFDCCPKIFTLPRSDCAICFAGNAGATYPLMIQLANAISAHQPARERSLDIHTLKAHLLRVFSDLLGSIKDVSAPIEASDVQFMFGGYSWLHKRFALWTIYYIAREKRFHARPSESFHPLLSQIAFAGDRAKEARAAVATKLNNCAKGERPEHFEYLPFAVLRDLLRAADTKSTIGGPPQLVRIAEHMNTRVMAVKWPAGTNKSITLLGRPLFEYENVDNWILDPDTFQVSRPRTFGHRSDDDTCRKDKSAVSTGDG